jgi:hypothetical protein
MDGKNNKRLPFKHFTAVQKCSISVTRQIFIQHVLKKNSDQVLVRGNLPILLTYFNDDKKS